MNAQEQYAEVLAAIEPSLRKRLDDWMVSTSEFYARQSGDSDRWRSGLVSYLMRGPGAVADAVLAALPDPEQAVREALDLLADGIGQAAAEEESIWIAQGYERAVRMIREARP